MGLPGLCWLLAGPAFAHDFIQIDGSAAGAAHAHYIANEGVLIRQGDLSIAFDPLPLSGFGVYPEPDPEQIKALMTGQDPFAGLDAVFISHAHRDHFSAPLMLAFMEAQPNVHLIVPEQALHMMILDAGWDEALLERITVLNPAAGDDPQLITLGKISASAVRIPHAGWPAPERAAVQNMVYRVTLDGGVTVIHMGDADPKRRHFTPHADHWAQQRTDTAFPPYWFLATETGRAILSDDMNIAHSIGVHVPLTIPGDLEASGADYFSKPGEVRVITLPVN